MGRDWIKIAVVTAAAVVIFATFVVYPFYECGWSALAYGERAFFAAAFGECK